MFFLGVGLQKFLVWFSRNYCLLRQRSWILLLIDSLFHLLCSKSLLIIYTASIKNLDNEFEGFGELLHKKINRSLQCFILTAAFS